MKILLALALALPPSVDGLDYPIGITNSGVFQRIDGKVEASFVFWSSCLTTTNSNLSHRGPKARGDYEPGELS